MVDESVANAFWETVERDGAATVATLLCVMGDRLGLFEAMAEGPATAAELSQRGQVSGRYAQEWLSCLTAHGYVRHDPATDRFWLPPEHGMVLRRRGEWSLAGGFQTLAGLLPVLEPAIEAFQTGAGVDPSAYGDDLYEGMARLSAPVYEQLLVPEWLPHLPDALQRLAEGTRAADVGCGEGRALIALATHFPDSSFVGYDQLPGVLATARRNAEAAEVADRVEFRVRDAAAGLPEQFDLITSFDMVHDAVDPMGVLRSIRRALSPGGSFLLVEANCGEQVDDNTGPVATRRYGISLLYCLSVSLARGGPGLGAMGMPESVVRRMCRDAGFAGVRRLPVDNPFSSLYEVTATPLG